MNQRPPSVLNQWGTLSSQRFEPTSSQCFEPMGHTLLTKEKSLSVDPTGLQTLIYPSSAGQSNTGVTTQTIWPVKRVSNLFKQSPLKQVLGNWSFSTVNKISHAAITNKSSFGRKFEENTDFQFAAVYDISHLHMMYCTFERSHYMSGSSLLGTLFVSVVACINYSLVIIVTRARWQSLDGVAHTGSRSSDHQLSVLQNLTDLLRHTFSSQFVFPVLGHEDPNPALGQSYREVADLWRHWLPTEALQTFNKGGYYTIEQKIRKLRLVAINTNLYTGLGGDEEDPKDQWAWLESVLGQSRKNKETVYLVGHVPPGVDERQSGAFLSHQAAFLERFNTRYLLLVRKYSDVIVGQFFGHLHSDSFRVVYKNNGRPVSWMFIAPAVSPRRTPSGANNPGLRLYKFDTDTGQVLDYVQYYLDLMAANQRDQAEWQPEYNLSSYYGLNEVSPASLNNLAESFITLEGRPLFDRYVSDQGKIPSARLISRDRDHRRRVILTEIEKFTPSTTLSPPTSPHISGTTGAMRYYRANSVRLHHNSDPRACDSSCAYNHYCAITQLDYTDFRGCLETEPSAFSSRATLQSDSSAAAILWCFFTTIGVVSVFHIS
ncbi:unnamed protein product [Timema podura]|uniref:Sphingomyelin phosphodiesterase C-terminal domain-containing protein n=1 Tax=Timema podura TaxID=61482 RepID=A0ABN7NE52_TIMPD|nr:unnamed protein product [Timema podura]